MTIDELKALSPPERVACALLARAKVAHLGARLRTKYAHISNDYYEGWTPAEESEWDDLVTECEVCVRAMTVEENDILTPMDLIFSQLTIGELP